MKYTTIEQLLSNDAAGVWRDSIVSRALNIIDAKVEAREKDKNTAG
jgi:hypothetical protein